MLDVKKVIIPIAGVGTRLLPATKAVPKEMLPLVDKPVIQYFVEEAVASGIKEIIFVASRENRATEDYFDRAPELERLLRSRGKKELADRMRAIATLAKFTYVRQDQPKGPGYALLQAAHLIGHDEPVAVLYNDDVVDAKIPCLKQLLDVFYAYRKPVLALDRVPRKQVSRYGIVGGKKIGPRTYQINKIVEKPRPEEAPSQLVSRGKYVYTPELFRLLAVARPRPGRELYQTDAFELYLKQGGRMYGYEYEGVLYDCGEKLGFIKATVLAGLKHPEIGEEFRRYLKKMRI
ncbi:MAG: UTP--glucose-1-phosphate uridylyltransferase [Candidatus Sungbacteria bacterium]|nr:UTP--glucose-1-phosphate uridylyltransferase [Candidatus Sungbacteria bacterium]